MNIKPQNGFTLIELLITIAIVGITLAFAVPGMNKMLGDDRIVTLRNTLLSDIMYARSEAVKRTQPTIICASSDQASCTGGNFEDGWIVTVDTDNNGIGDDLIRIQPEIPGNITFQQAGLSAITFDSRGFLPRGANTGTISVCDDRVNPNDYAKTISLSPTGRPSRGANPACI